MRKGRVSILFGGLTGISSIAVIQLISVPELDLPLTIAMWCFAFSLPLSAFYTLSAQEHLKVNGTKVPTLYEAFAILTMLVGFSGLAAGFWHIGFWPLMIFSVASLMAIVALNNVSDKKKQYFLPPTKIKKGQALLQKKGKNVRKN